VSGSLRLRLLGLAAVTIALALALAWLGLRIVFDRHVRGQVVDELAAEIVGIVAHLEERNGKVILTAEPVEERFKRPLGGAYWQIDVEGGDAIRSRSLWDETIPAPEVDEPDPVVFEAHGPGDERVLVRSERLTLATGSGERRLRVTMATSEAEVEEAVAEFGRDLAVALGMLGLVLIAAALVQIGIGLEPLRGLRAEVEAVRAGRKARLAADVPTEVRPLVEEVNELLSGQEAALARARAQAADLAHGLKTPLTIVGSLTRELAQAGRKAEAKEVEEQLAMMGRHIDRQLARARLGADGRTTCRLRPLVERLVDLMRRTPRGERLGWRVAVDPGGVVAADETDVAEALGNVLENACKFASTTVRITGECRSTIFVLCVDDDGPGVPDERRNDIVARGKRLAGDASGAGLGLAIVTDILAAYGGGLELERSPLGGLRVQLLWPATPNPS
jgi:signal transduction histidine kinase